jgi:hypothetical protein
VTQVSQVYLDYQETQGSVETVVVKQVVVEEQVDQVLRDHLDPLGHRAPQGTLDKEDKRVE